jgi:hypothetical protein
MSERHPGITLRLVRLEWPCCPEGQEGPAPAFDVHPNRAM